MNGDEALYEIAARSQRAATAQLESLIGRGNVEPGRITILPAGVDPLANLAFPTLAAMSRYADGSAGGYVLVLPDAAARRLAGASSTSTTPLTAGQLTQISEMLDRVFTVAATASSRGLSQRIEVASVVVSELASPEDAGEILGRGTSATAAEIRVAGAACRLIQCAPASLVGRVAQAMANTSATSVEGPPLGEVLSGVPVRLWAELGRKQMPIAELLQMPPGAILELDCALEDPIDIYVDGMRFAVGRLETTEHDVDLVIEEILAP